MELVNCTTIKTIFLLSCMNIYAATASAQVVDIKGPFIVSEDFSGRKASYFRNSYFDIELEIPAPLQCSPKTKYFGTTDLDAGVSLSCDSKFISRSELLALGFSESLQGETSQLEWNDRFVSLVQPAADVKANLFLQDYSETARTIQGIGATLTLTCLLSSSKCSASYLLQALSQVSYSQSQVTRINLRFSKPTPSCYPVSCPSPAIVPPALRAM